MSTLRILISAYACEPGKGSEPGRGWSTVSEIGKHHDVWVITRKNNRLAIEAALAKVPIPGLHFEYYDLPAPALALKRGPLSTEVYYYLWQLGMVGLAKRLNTQGHFDAVHHVTFNRYWSPSGLAFLDNPFIWGQVGGAESTPPELRHTLGLRGRVADVARNLVRACAEYDPLLRRTARRCAVAIGGSQETCQKLTALGASRVELLGGSGLSKDDIRRLANISPVPDKPFRLISIGRMAPWKGYHLSLQAYLQAKIPDSEYWFVGDGPDRQRLERMAQSLPQGRSVRFFGKLPRNETLDLLGKATALVHPSLHDSAGWAYLEGMASSRPVICMNIGGGAVQVTDECGIRVQPGSEEMVVNSLADAMRKLHQEPATVATMGRNGANHVSSHFDWEVKMKTMLQVYSSVVSTASFKS